MATTSLALCLSLSLSLTQHVISIKPFVELYTPGLPRSVRLAFSAPGAAPPPPLNAVADVPIAPPAPAPPPPAPPPPIAVSAHAACCPSSPQSRSSTSSDRDRDWDRDSSEVDPLSDDLILQFGIFAMCLLLCSSSGINMFHLLSLHRAALLAPIVNVLRGAEKQKRRFSKCAQGGGGIFTMIFG